MNLLHFSDYQRDLINAMKRLSPSMLNGKSGNEACDHYLHISPKTFRKLKAAGNSVAKQASSMSVIKKSNMHFNTPLPPSGAKPDFMCVDFGLALDSNGELMPKLIEIQSFPTIMAANALAAKCMGDGSKITLLKQQVLADYDPKNVVLLENNLYNQPAVFDFEITRAITGAGLVDLKDMIVNGDNLFYIRNGVKTPIHRIYNRVVHHTIPVELKNHWEGILDANVEWLNHPIWFDIVSKGCLPFIKGDFNPGCMPAEGYSGSLKNKILKPIDGFSGRGVVMKPQFYDLVYAGKNCVVQDKIQLAPSALSPANSLVYVEFRMIYSTFKRWGTPDLNGVLVRFGATPDITLSKRGGNQYGFAFTK